MLIKIVRCLTLFFCLFIVLRYSMAIVWGRHDFWTFLSHRRTEQRLLRQVERLNEQQGTLSAQVELWQRPSPPIDLIEAETLRQLHRVPPGMMILAD